MVKFFFSVSAFLSALKMLKLIGWHSYHFLINVHAIYLWWKDVAEEKSIWGENFGKAQKVRKLFQSLPALSAIHSLQRLQIRSQQRARKTSNERDMEAFARIAQHQTYFSPVFVFAWKQKDQAYIKNNNDKNDNNMLHLCRSNSW